MCFHFFTPPSLTWTPQGSCTKAQGPLAQPVLLAQASLSIRTWVLVDFHILIPTSSACGWWGACPLKHRMHPNTTVLESLQLVPYNLCISLELIPGFPGHKRTSLPKDLWASRRCRWLQRPHVVMVWKIRIGCYMCIDQQLETFFIYLYITRMNYLGT